MSEAADTFRGLGKGLEPASVAHWNRLGMFAVVVRSKPCVNGSDVRQVQADEPRNCLVL